MNRTTYTKRIALPTHYPQQCFQDTYERAKHDLGNILYDLLLQQKTPVVVEINETPTRILPNYEVCVDYSFAYDQDMYVMDIEIGFTPVKYRDTEIIRGHYHQLEYYSPTPEKFMTKLNRLWRKYVNNNNR